jgi:hypothetical protein
MPSKRRLKENSPTLRRHYVCMQAIVSMRGLQGRAVREDGRIAGLSLAREKRNADRYPSGVRPLRRYGGQVEIIASFHR